MTTEKEELKSFMITTMSQGTSYKGCWDMATGNPTLQVVLERKRQGREGGWQPAVPEICPLLTSVPPAANPGPHVLFLKNRLVGERSFGGK